jgi:hypothetical protein
MPQQGREIPGSPDLPHLFSNIEHRTNTQLHQTTEPSREYGRNRHFAIEKTGNQTKVYGGERGEPPCDVVGVFKTIFACHSLVPFMLW